MILPGKEKLVELLNRPVESADLWLNRRLEAVSRRTAALALLSAGLGTAVASALFLYFNSSTITGVGSISSPTILEHTNRALGDKSPLETFYEIQRTQSFLDSVDQLGIERMEEIYLERYKSANYD